jgi:hypothetical protein
MVSNEDLRKIENLKRVHKEMAAAKAVGTYTGWVAIPIDPNNDPYSPANLRAAQKRARSAAAHKAWETKRANSNK